MHFYFKKKSCLSLQSHVALSFVEPLHILQRSISFRKIAMCYLVFSTKLDFTFLFIYFFFLKIHRNKSIIFAAVFVAS